MTWPPPSVIHRLRLRGGIFLLFVAVMTGACSPPPFPIISEATGDRRELVVFDVDGTLTPDVFSTSTPREHAAEAVDVYASNRLRVVYLSARFPWFSSRLPGWLEEHGFAKGPIFVAQSLRDNRNPSRFKRGVLEDLKHNGWKFAAAYGDSSTDFSAYSDAGIPGERIFALKRKGLEQCEPGPWVECLDGWGQQLSYITSQLTAEPVESDQSANRQP